jgi:glycine/D-amino acid oxidase-like deaminating enzyme
MPRPDVLVVGGGIVGLALARELAGRGVTVELVDRGVPGDATPADAASFAAAGMLAPLAEAPLAEAPQPTPFFRACRDARDLWRTWGPELAAESGVALDHDTAGALVRFGGCVVAVAERERAEQVLAGAAQRYRDTTGLTGDAFVARAVEGASR